MRLRTVLQCNAVLVCGTLLIAPALADTVPAGAASPGSTGAGAASVNPTPPAPDKSDYTLFNPTPDAQERSFNTDRPNKSNSPYTVDAGHFQYETDLIGAVSDGYAPGHTYTHEIYTADPVLKLGITNDLDLELQLGGFQDLRTKQRNAGPAQEADGFGDLYIRAKYNLWGNDGGRTAMALIPYIKLPTAAAGLGNDQVEGGIIAPFEISLPADFSLVVETEVDFLKNANDSGHHASTENIVNLSHTVFSPKLTASAELYSQVAAADTPSQYTADFALAYLLGPNTQIDGGVYAGLNKAAPDMVVYAGLSQRF